MSLSKLSGGCTGLLIFLAKTEHSQCIPRGHLQLFSRDTNNTLLISRFGIRGSEGVRVTQ